VSASLGWTLRAVTLSAELSTLLPQALTNAGADYPGSVIRMLEDARAVASFGLDAARCGASLVGSRATRVAATVAGSAALPEASQYTAMLRDGMLQLCPDDAALARIDAAVDAAGAFVAADKARAGSMDFADAARALVAHAIGEGWTAASYAALGDLVTLGVVRLPECAMYPSYARQAVCIDSSLATFSTARGKLLDPALAARHARFARDLLPIRRGWLSGFAFLGTQQAIDDAFFDSGLWTGCTDQGFAASQATLFQELGRLQGASALDRFAIADTIAALVSSSTCP